MKNLTGVSPEQVKKRLNATPFRPFTLCLTSGQMIKVPHPEFAYMPPKPNDWEMVVFDEDKAFNIIDLGEVACLKELRPARRNGRK